MDVMSTNIELARIYNVYEFIISSLAQLGNESNYTEYDKFIVFCII